MRTTTAANGDTITESDDIISVTWSWTTEYDEFPTVEHRLTWIKGEPRLYFELRVEGGAGWSSMPVRHPDYRPTSLANARELAHRFINEGFREE